MTDDKHAVLQVICKLFEEDRTDWMPAGKLAQAVSDKLDIKPAYTATRLKPIMEDLGVDLEIRRHGQKKRPIEGYTAHHCALALLQQEAVVQFEQASPQAALDHAHGTSHDIKTCASLLLGWVGSLEPLWASHIQALKDERGFNDWQALVSLTAYTLEHGLHMIVPNHPALEGAAWHPGEKECSECFSPYHEAYPGQATCGSYNCGKSYNAKKKQSHEESLPVA